MRCTESSDNPDGKDDVLDRALSRREFLRVAGITGAAIGVSGGLGGLLAACGGETTTTTAAGTTATTTAAASTTTAAASTTTTTAESTTTVTAADFDSKVAALIEAYATKPDLTPTAEMSAGPKAVKDKKLLFIPIILAGVNQMQQHDAELKKITRLVGWQYSVIDPMFDPNKVANAFSQALSLKVDGVTTLTVDATQAAAPIKALTDAGIPVCGTGSDDPQGLYTFREDDRQSWKDVQGYLTAAAGYYYAKQANQPMKVIATWVPGVAVGDERYAGLKQFIEEARGAGKDAEILAEVHTTIAGIGTELPPRMISAVQSNPTYTVLWAGIDSLLTVSHAALASVQLYDTKKVWVASDCSPESVADMRAGGAIKAVLGAPVVWYAWQAIDDFNRVFNGLEPLGGAARGFAKKMQLVTQTNVTEFAEKEFWDDYMSPLLEAQYKALWGIA